jgi:TetR/AcrR family transcriptional regulator, regulator of autoinduction and epiphytic fitness
VEDTAEDTADAVVDGRVQRGVRSRTAVVDAILDLLVEGVTQPTAQMVADRSGISVRSIFRLFDDMASLHQAAAARQAERLEALLVPLPEDGPLTDRIAALVVNRADVYEVIGPVRRAGVRLADTSEPIARQLRRASVLFRRQVARTFRIELADAGPEMLDALDLATCWEAWDRLRTVQGLDVAAAARVFTVTVGALLAADETGEA